MALNTHPNRADNLKPYVLVVTRVLPVVLVCAGAASLSFCSWLAPLPGF